MRSIRCGSGLGDSLYLQGVVRHLVEKGEGLEVRTDWPDVFRPLSGSVRLTRFNKTRCDVVAHYSDRKLITETDQFEDVCINAGIRGPVDFRLDWKVTNRVPLLPLLACGKPIVCVQLPRQPMDRPDAYGRELLPDGRCTQGVIDRLKGRALLVQIGKGKPLFEYTGIDVDLANRTTVAEMFDVASVATAFVGYCSFMVPLAESLKKPALFVWARRGLASQHSYIRTITPGKILHRDSSKFVFDDWPEARISDAIESLLHKGNGDQLLQGEVGSHRRQRPWRAEEPARVC